MSTRGDPEDMGTLRYQLLVGWDRWVVAGGIAGTVFFTLLLVGLYEPVDFRAFIAEKDPIQNLFQALILILITGVTLVLSINQLVLSQELVAAADQKERLDVALEFRSDVAELIAPEVTPGKPARFFAAVLQATRRYANGMRTDLPDDASDAFASDVDAFVDNIITDIEETVNPLEEAEFGTMNVIGQALRFNNTDHLFDVSELMGRHEDEFTEPFRNRYSCVLASLEHFALGREYFKSLYIQRELIQLSERMIYISVPALIVTLTFVLFVDETVAPGQTLGIDHLFLLVISAVTLAITPFALLVVYVLRVGVITRMTLAVGPFRID